MMSTITRRPTLPGGDENSIQTSSSFTPSSRSPSKMPTLSDIAARLNRDRSSSLTPTSSPQKAASETSKGRLEIMGRITASPKLMQSSEKTRQDERPSSPSKRMLASGLPSFEVIQERVLAKKTPSVPTSPIKIASSESTPKAETVSPVVVEAAAKEVPQSLPSSLPDKPEEKVHLLQHGWSLYFDHKSATSSTPSTPTLPLSSSSWYATLRTIGAYSSVESFLSTFSHLSRPSQLPPYSSYHLFKSDIKPMWEDPANTAGGKWTVTFKAKHPALVDRTWLWLVLALIGQELEQDGDEVCGAVVSTRPRGDRIALWVRNKDKEMEKVGRKMVDLLELGKEPGVCVEFSSHEGAGRKEEGWWGVNNPMPSPGVEGVGSPNTHGNGARFGRLGGQGNANAIGGSVFTRSPSSLGQSLRLVPGSTSPTMKESNKSPASRSPVHGAIPWRANSRNPSPQRPSPSPSARPASPFKVI